MIAFRCALTLALVAALGFSQEVLTNEDILKLVKAGMETKSSLARLAASR